MNRSTAAICRHGVRAWRWRVSLAFAQTDAVPLITAKADAAIKAAFAQGAGRLGWPR